MMAEFIPCADCDTDCPGCNLATLIAVDGVWLCRAHAELRNHRPVDPPPAEA